MKGRNTILLNRASMAAAMQFWLNSQLKTDQKVETVNFVAAEGGRFEVIIAEQIEEAAK